jgi:hypothetical protein
MSDADLIRDANYIANSIIERWGWKEGYRQARKCLSEAETRYSQGYWLRVCLALEHKQPTENEK